jgi:hypothetical protein
MRIHRFLSLTDLVVLTVVAVAIFLPKRPIYAVDAYKLDADARADLGAAEAAAMAKPADGFAAYELARRLARAKQLDWAVETGAETAARATDGSKWRALLAVAEARADRIDVQLAFEAAEEALDACIAAGEPACPAWERLKIELFRNYLDAGLKSGINPRTHPQSFKKAAGETMHMVDIDGVTPGIPR